MPVEYELTERGSLVKVRATGHVTSEEINGFLMRLREDPGLQPDHLTLFDATEVTSESLSDPEFRQALTIERGNPEKLIPRRMAIVATELAILRSALAYHSVSPLLGEPTQVFSDVQEAMAWLTRREP